MGTEKRKNRQRQILGCISNQPLFFSKVRYALVFEDEQMFIEVMYWNRLSELLLFEGRLPTVNINENEFGTER